MKQDILFQNPDEVYNHLLRGDLSGRDKIMDVIPDLAVQLAGTPQDHRWHSEGDVLCHTGMVIDELLAGQRFPRLPEYLKQVVLMAAVLHDCAKPEKTRHEMDGSITSHHHASAGSIKARGILYRSGFDPKFREMVCTLIALHHKPIWVARRYSENELIKFGYITQGLTPLVALCDADARGRVTEDPAQHKEAIELVQLFEIMAEDNDLLMNPPVFSDDHSRFMFCQDVSKWHFGTPVYDDYRGGITILSGIAGSGKNTWVSQNGYGKPVICLDDIRNELNRRDGAVIQEAILRAKKYMASSTPFIWNSTNLTINERSRLIEMAMNYKTKIEIVAIETPYDEIKKRNKTRPGDEMLPKDVLEYMIDKWQFPNLTESHSFSWIDGMNFNQVNKIDQSQIEYSFF